MYTPSHRSKFKLLAKNRQCFSHFCLSFSDSAKILIYVQFSIKCAPIFAGYASVSTEQLAETKLAFGSMGEIFHYEQQENASSPPRPPMTQALPPRHGGRATDRCPPTRPPLDAPRFKENLKIKSFLGDQTDLIDKHLYDCPKI